RDTPTLRGLCNLYETLFEGLFKIDERQLTIFVDKDRHYFQPVKLNGLAGMQTRHEFVQYFHFVLLVSSLRKCLFVAKRPVHVAFRSLSGKGTLRVLCARCVSAVNILARKLTA